MAIVSAESGDTRRYSAAQILSTLLQVLNLAESLRSSEGQRDGSGRGE